jgi:site-specific recombinase XerD
MAIGSVDDLGRSFERHLRAENKSEQTIQTYLEAVSLLSAFLAARSLTVAEARREHIEAFLGDLLGRWKPATANNRYRSLRRFYAWLEEEGEIRADPMAKLRPPAVPEQPVPVLSDDELQRLLATCAGRDFEARRDRAILMLLVDSGARRAELAGLRLVDVDFDLDVARGGWQGWPGAGSAVRPQDRPDAGPLPPGPVSPPPCPAGVAVDRQVRSSHGVGHPSDPSPPRPPSRD